MQSQLEVIREFRRAVLAGEISAAALAKMSPEQIATIKHWQSSWAYRARDKQLEPGGNWRHWLVRAGRGFGKTLLGSEWVNDRANSGVMRFGAIVGRTDGDTYKVMLFGPSGIIATASKQNPVEYNSQRKTLSWANGATALCFSAEEPNQIRGPEFDTVWGDELAAWQYADETFSNIDFALRRTDGKGNRPRGLFTTTPLPTKIIKDLSSSPDVALTVGSTRENAANLDPGFLRRLEEKYAGTRLGRQEMDAEILEDTEGALWTLAMIEQAKQLFANDTKEKINRIVVAIDPAITSGINSDETGIIVCGTTIDAQFAVMNDLTCKLSPHGWAARAVEAYHQHKADAIVAESNQGGDMVKATIMAVDNRVNVKLVHATKSKKARAEPIAALYEQGKVIHFPGLERLEDQLTTYTGTRGDISPDRHDALVWGMTDLLESVPAVNHGFFFG